MIKPDKLSTEEINEAISAEEAMNTIQQGIIDELADVECDLIRARNDSRFIESARIKINKLKKELIADIDISD